MGENPISLISALLAQLVERKTFNLVAVGSSPTESISVHIPERSKGSDLRSDA